MSKYFFDIHDDQNLTTDDEGVEFATFEEVRLEAKRILPQLAVEALPENGDRKTYVVLVRAEDGTPVYSATLAFAGLRLQGDTKPSPLQASQHAFKATSS